MITSDCLVIEKLSGTGGVRISFGDWKEIYLGYSLKDAEARFRQEHDLKGKKLQRILSCH